MRQFFCLNYNPITWAKNTRSRGFRIAQFILESQEITYQGLFTWFYGKVILRKKIFKSLH